MSGDYTRFTFDPAKGYSGVHKQQGRVSLDADFNEFEEILDRRDRSTALDTFGGSVVPSTTPDAFKIGVDAQGNLVIGTGRAYVDGIQAENFGDLRAPAGARYDTAVGNLVNDAPIAFDTQPFFYRKPNASLDFPSISATPGTLNLVYLDVWQREVTSWEDERLLDPALGGPDTATRVQTAWQVKALAGVQSDACTKLPPELGASSARMTAMASAAPPAPLPCVIQPAGGYTGLENRLYRVEVHKAGTLGGANPATFVWSRDNASLIASVLSIKAVPGGSIITVDSTGRDTWMRFENDQQLELVDDAVELALRESGTGGDIARITSVNHATGEITIDQNLAAFVITPTLHPRVRRWDTAAPADQAERPVTNGTQLALEDGIKVSFGDGTAAHDADTLRAGDYWVFAARTATGAIDVVDSAPPRGNLHHVMPLAMVTSGTPPTVDSDCRPAWPTPCECGEGGGCECDWCVTQESHASGELTVQDAVQKAVDAGGGTVCIGRGEFRFERSLKVSDVVSMRIHGAGVATVLEYMGEDAALTIEHAVDVHVRDLVIVTNRSGRLARNAVEVADAAIVTLERLEIVEDPAALIGVVAGVSPRFTVSVSEGLVGGRGDRPLGGAIALRGVLLRMTISDCLLMAGTGVLVPRPGEGEDAPYLIAADLEISDNVVFATTDGLRFDGRPDRSTILVLDRLAFAANSIYGCTAAGITLVGVAPLGGLDTLGRIGGSTLAVLGDGIVTGLDGTAIENNNLLALRQDPIRDGDGRRGSRGISLARGTESVLREVSVDANRIVGFLGGGVVVDADVATVMVTDNQIRSCGGGVTMTDESTGDRVVVRGNTILELPFAVIDGSEPAYGISLSVVNRGEVLDNHVQQYDRELVVIGRPPA